MTSAPHQRQLSILIEGASFGITITAGAPTMRAPAATAWPWLPDEKATKPLFRFSSGVDRILFNAPRILNEPVFCSGSAFTSTLAPASSSSIAEAEERRAHDAAGEALGGTADGGDIDRGHGAFLRHCSLRVIPGLAKREPGISPGARSRIAACRGFRDDGA